jgi:hypothetical protein
MCGTTAAEQCFAALDDPNAETFTVFADDVPCAMFGLTPNNEMGMPPGAGVLWFLGTPLLYKIRKDFTKQVRHWLDWLQRAHPIGFNFISFDNHISLRWARSVGFTICQTESKGRNGELFTVILRQMDVPDTDESELAEMVDTLKGV